MWRCCDQDKALDFYTNVIGLEKRGDYPTPAGPRFLTVGVEGQDFELVLWPGTPARGEAGSAVYTIEVEDIGAVFETLKSRGVKFEPPEILEFPWVTLRGSRIRTGIWFRCERVAGSFGAESGQ
jgi:catechol 2,3-dioxygenase-like lactoylglutathione lyase family enzyme